MYSALRPEGLNTITLTLVQTKAFKQHLARWEHSLSNSPDNSQVMTGYGYAAGRCCLYRFPTISLFLGSLLGKQLRGLLLVDITV